MCTALTLPISSYESYETGRGRIDNRWVGVYQNRAEMPVGWHGIQRLVKVRRWGIRRGKEYDNLSYYILSQPINHASIVAKAIRGHWGIENALHWTKDVLIGEDQMTIKEQQAASLVGILNTTAINLIRLAGYKPNKNAFAKFANNVNELNKLLAF